MEGRTVLHRSTHPSPRIALRPGTIVAVLMLAIVATPTWAQDESPVAQSTAPLAETADRVDLPAGWQPEGITSMDGSLYVGSLADGAIWKVDATTRQGDIFVPGTEGAVAVGVEADAANGRLWVAGGNTGEVRAYAADSGELLATYTFEGGFLNDLVATPEAVFVTDSNVQQLGVIPIGADGSLPDPSAATTLPLTGDFVYLEDAFNANGIVAAPGGLIVVQSATGSLFRVDPATGETTAIDAGGADLTFGDGLELSGAILYVSRNQAEIIASLELDEALTSATLVGEATSDGLDVPTTVALDGEDLWIVNARFGTEATPETEYWLSIWPGGQPPAG
jgi:streptogramin lyase